MIVHKDKMIIRESKKYLNTDEGKKSQKENERYKKLANS